MLIRSVQRLIFGISCKSDCSEGGVLVGPGDG